MRTRRSWRNQEHLWEALAGPVEPQRPPAPRTDAEIEAMGWLPASTRNPMKRDAQKQRIRALRRFYARRH